MVEILNKELVFFDLQFLKSSLGIFEKEMQGAMMLTQQLLGSLSWQFTAHFSSPGLGKEDSKAVPFFLWELLSSALLPLHTGLRPAASSLGCVSSLSTGMSCKGRMAFRLQLSSGVQKVTVNRAWSSVKSGYTP